MTVSRITAVLLLMTMTVVSTLAQNRGKPPKAREAEAAKPAAEEEKTFRVDFRDQDILDFLKAMSAIIGKNIVADENVKGKITVISPRKIPMALAYPYLNSVLAIRGYGILEEGPSLIKVVTLKDAVAKSQQIYLGREPIPAEKNEDGSPITHIVPVLGGKPSRLSAVLKRVTNANTEVVDYDEIEMLIITGARDEVNRLVSIIALIDKEGPEVVEEKKETDSFGNVHVYQLENLKAEAVEATLRKVNVPGFGVDPNKKQDDSAPKPPKPLEVVASKEANSVIFVGSREEFEVVKDLIRRLDLKRQQILLEVLIVEISADDTNSFGIDWRLNNITQFNSGLVGEGNIVRTTGTNIGDATGVNTLLGFSLGFIENAGGDVIGLLNANLKNDKFAVVSAPQVLTLDNQEAEINVGADIQVRTGQRVTDLNNVITQFDFRPVGVKLKFTPQINKNKLINLELYQEVRAIQGATDDANANPQFSKRDIKTVVRVKDQQTIVIGGLISTEKTKNLRKIPLLGDLPLVGYLFKRTSNVLKRTNLLVFITPHLLTERSVADKITDNAKEVQKNFITP